MSACWRQPGGPGSDGAACLSLAALWAVFWWPVVSGAERLFTRDLPGYAAPAKHYWRERVLAGELPAWMPSIDAGSPFLADVGFQALYPLNLLFLLDQPIAAMLSLFIALHFLSGALGMYALLRVFDAGVWLSLWGAAVYLLSGYGLGIADNINYTAGVAWVPCLLAAFTAGITRASLRCIALAAVFLAMLTLAGDLLDAGIAGSVCLALSIARLRSALRARETMAVTRLLMLAALVPVLALLLAAAQVLPTLELLSISVRAEALDADERRIWSLPPQRIVELLHPYLFGTNGPRAQDYLLPGLYPRQHNPWSESIYLGPMVIGCALAAMVFRTRAALGWLLLTVLSAVLAMTGRFQWLLDLSAQLPVFSSQRYFEKLALWVCVGLVMLAALGARALLEPAREPLPRSAILRTALAMLLLIGFWLSLDMALAWLPAERIAEASAFWSSRLPVVVNHVIGPVSHALLWMPLLAACLLSRGPLRRQIVMLALVATLGDLFWMHHGRYISAPAELVTDDTTPAAIGGILAVDPHGLDQGRVFFDYAVATNSVTRMEASPVLRRVRDAWQTLGLPETRDHLAVYSMIMSKERLTPNSGIQHGVRYFNGDWTPLRPAHIRRLESELLPTDPALLLGLGGVRWLVTAAEPRNFVWENAGFEEVALRRDVNLRILRAPATAPRAWLSRRESVDTPALDFLDAAGEVRVVEDRPERLWLAVDAGADARWLVVGETLMPGWRAWLDGDETEPVRAGGGFIGMPITAGRHEVRLEYTTPGLAAGVALSSFGLLLLVVLLVRGGRLSPTSEVHAS